jgi:hypothetical protein
MMCIRCRPARGLVLIYREFSLAEISFVGKYCDVNYLLLYSLTPSTRSRFELYRILFGGKEYLRKQF